jgi:DNA-binding MarR family transcriptional regulator
MAKAPQSSETKAKSAASVIRLPCACANLRRTARLVSQLYKDAIRPAGITGPQFTLLQALKLVPGTSQKWLAELLGMDSTTLTRTLALMRKRGWLKSQPAKDRRALRLGLSAAGERQYERALPYWQSAQRRLKRALGDKKLDGLIDAVLQVAEAIQ